MTDYLKAYRGQVRESRSGARSFVTSLLDRKAQAIGQRDRHALFLPRVINNFGLHKQALSLLDIGIGNGLYMSYRDPALTKYGTDLSDHFRSELSAMDIELFVTNSESESLPLPDASLDIVMANHLIEHIWNYNALVAEVRRVLKPGGGFLIRTPNIERVRFKFYDDCTHIKAYSIAGLNHLAQIHGFSPIKTLYSDHPRILLDSLTNGKLAELIFTSNRILPGGNEIETYWIKDANDEKTRS